MPNFSGAIARDPKEKHGERPSVLDFGAVGDALLYADGAVPASSTAFVSMLATFTVDDEGKAIVILGAGAAGATHVTTIATFVDANHITLTVAAVTAVSVATFVYGTDDTQAFQDTADALPDGSQWEFSVPKAKSAYLTTAAVSAGARKVTIRMSGCTWYAASTLLTVTEDTPGETNHDGGCVSIFGCGIEQSSITYLLNSGNLIQQTQINGPKFRHVTISALAASNTATCFALNSNFNVSISELAIYEFSVGINLYGEASPDGRGAHFDLTNLSVRNFTVAGIMLSHSVDVHITNASVYGIANNPTFAWGLIVDTDTSGVYITYLPLGWGGMVIRNTLSTPGAFGGPPEWVFANGVIADSMTTAGIRCDVSLKPAGDIDGRGGRGYHFNNAWSAFSQTNGDCTVELMGGSEISFTDFRARVSRQHSYLIDGSDNVRLINCIGIASNAQGIADGAGVYLKSSGINLGVQILGGRYGDAVESLGNQDWGVYIADTFHSPLQIVSADLRDNQIGAIRPGGTGERQIGFNLIGTPGVMRVPPTAGDPLGNISQMSCDKGRFEFGDGAYYADYKQSSGPDDVGWYYDTEDTLRYIRAVDRWDFLIANVSLLRLALTGGNSIMIQNRPSAAGGLLNGLLNSSLDADASERFNIRGDGMITWGDGTVVDVILERLSAALARLSSDFHVTGKMGVGIAPETGWNFKAPAIKATSGLRVDPMAGTGNRPAKWSSLGDPVAAPINLASAEVTDTLQIANGGSSGITAAAARTNFDVYSKAEVDTLLAGKADVSHGHSSSIASNHTHSGAVPSDGTHNHTIT